MSNQQYYYNPEIISYAIRFQNYTQFPIYMSDGSGSAPIKLPPLIDQYGNINHAMPQGAAGKVIAIKGQSNEVPMTVGWGINYDQHTLKWDTVADPPTNPDDLRLWRYASFHYNVIFAGSAEALHAFVKQYGSVYNYIKVHTFGTRFHNSINYGILNNTKRPLYQVDDTSKSATGYAEIITLPSGASPMIPMFNQQIANDLFNKDDTRPYVRVYRYEMMNVNTFEYVGHMREQIHYWDINSDSMVEDGFMYIPEFHVCLFERVEDAEEFIRRFKTVQIWEKMRFESWANYTVTQYAKRLAADMDSKNRAIIKGCAIFVSLQIAWKLGEVCIWAIKEHNKTKRQGLRKPKEFTTGLSPGSAGLANILGPLFV